MRLGRIALFAFIVAVFPLVAGASGWQESPHAGARLIAGGAVPADALARRTDLPGPALLAGLEIRLDRGWKTYWRTPGDGIAPQFDWTGSQNAAAIEVLWPAPDHFRDAAGEYNGYAEHVVLPIAITPEQPGAPVAVKLRLDYAVCKDVCIPVSKMLSLRLSGEPGRERDALMAALRKVPVRADGAGRRCQGLRLADVRAQLDGPTPRLEITLRHAPRAKPEDLFIEASSGQFMAHPERGKSAVERTVFHLDPSAGGDPHALVGQTLTLTAVAASQSCEMRWTVE